MIRALTLILVGIALGGRCTLRGQTADERIESLMEKAQAAQKSEDFEGARLAYEEILKIRPYWGPAEFNLGLMFYVQKQYPEAIRSLTAALQHDPTLASALLFRGIAYFNIGHHEKALASLRQYLKLRPRDTEVHFFLGETFFALRDYPNAAKHYLAQVKLAPKREDLYYHLGECYLVLARDMAKNLGDDPGGKYFLWLISAEGHAHQQGDPSTESHIQEALKIDATAPEAYVSLGQLLLRQGNAAAAKTNFEKALTRKAGDCRALMGIADAETMMGNTRASLEAFERVMRIWPSCLVDPPEENIGHLEGEVTLHLKSRLTEAVAGSCQPALHRQSPVAGEIELIRAGCLESKVDLDGATQALNAAVSLSPRNARVKYWAYRIYMRLSQRCIAKLMSVSPSSHLLAMMRAQALEQQRNDEEASREYERAVAFRGGDPEPLIQYARFKCKQNQFAEAIPLLQEALKLDPYNMRANALLGEVYAGTNHPEAAIVPLRLAINAAPEDEQSRINLAQSLARLDRVKDAIAVLEAALSDPDGRIHYVLGTYYRRQGRMEDAARALRFFDQRRRGRAQAAAVTP